ncbi:hypothetical protein Dimus_002079 [Dionaea muscipula]
MVSASTENDAAAGVRQGSIIRFTYTALAISRNLRGHFSSSPSSLPLLCVELLVPASYPDTSPEIIGRSPVVLLGKELEDLTENTICRFSMSLKSLPEPMSLSDMARAWDDSARRVFSDLASQMNGKQLRSPSTLGNLEWFI